MAITYNKNAQGLYEVFQDGQRISTTSSESYAKSLASGSTSSPAPSPTPTPSPSSSSPSSSTPTSLPPLPDMDEAMTNFTNLNVALNKAVDLARQQRQDKTLDMLGGVIPPGALPASSFAGVISAFNRSSAPVASEFAGSALGFAESAINREYQTALDERNRLIQKQEEEQERFRQSQDSVRDLQLSLIEQGVKSDQIALLTPFIEKGDINGAITVATGMLQNTPQAKDFQFFSRDEGIVAVDKETGESTVVFSGGGTTTSPTSIEPQVSWAEYLKTAEQELLQKINPASQLYKDLYKQWEDDYKAVTPQVSSGVKFTNQQILKLEQAGLLNASRQEQLDYLFKESSLEDKIDSLIQ